MDIDLIAYIKKYNDFTLNYKVGDERKLYNGKSLLFYSSLFTSYHLGFITFIIRFHYG